MSSEVTTHYHQKIVFCGKARCKKCREGTGHGPYWYETRRALDGKTTRTYLGTQQQAVAHLLEQIDRSLAQDDLASAIDLLSPLLAAASTQQAVMQRLIIILVRLSQHAPHPSWPRSHRSPLVGRDQEMVRLRALLHGPPTPSPHCIFLNGDVGLGKTRLAEELAQEAMNQGWSVIWARAHALEYRFSYALWSEVLRQVLSPHSAAMYGHLLVGCPHLFQPLCALLPHLRACFEESPADAPEQEPRRLWEAVGELLLLMSDVRPFLIVLDDLHWADAGSCELLAYLLRRLRGKRVVLVGTYRNNDLPALHPLRAVLGDLQRERVVDSLSLSSFDEEQMKTFLSVLRVPWSLRERVRAQAAGNPFFAEELARTLAGSEIPVGTQSPLPESITAVLDLRLSQLSQPCQRFLGKAAVLGDRFSFNVISALENEVSGSRDAIVLDLLEEALGAGLLVEEGASTDITYEFWHPLLVTRLYEQLSAARRRTLHQRVATILQHSYQGREEEVASTLTHHLVEGGADAAVIIQYATMAGDRAYRLAAYPDAAYLYSLAVEQMEALQTHASLSVEDQERLVWLLVYQAECLRIQGHPVEARAAYQHALTLRERQPRAASQEEAQILALLSSEVGLCCYDTQDLEQALTWYVRGEEFLYKAEIDSGPAWARLRYEQSYVHWRAGRNDEALRLASDALTLFTASLAHPCPPATATSIAHSTRISRTLAGDPADLGRTHQLLGLIANGAGNSTEARFHLEEAMHVSEQYRSTRELAIVCCNLGDVYLRRAEYDRAKRMLQRCWQYAEQIGDLPLVAFAQGNLGLLSISCGSLQEAESWCLQAVETASQLQDGVASALWMAYLAYARTEQGRLSEASTDLARALQGARAARLPFYLGRMLSVVAHLRLAQIEADTTSPETGTARRAQSLRRARSTVLRALGQSGIETEVAIECRLHLAQISIYEDDLASAYQQAHRALTLAQQSEGEGLLARTHCLLGNILAKQGQDGQAEHAFETASEMCERLGMRLEHARVSLSYGQFLLQRKKNLQRCVSLLQDAQQTLSACKAAQAERFAEQLLATAALLLP